MNNTGDLWELRYLTTKVSTHLMCANLSYQYKLLKLRYGVTVNYTKTGSLPAKKNIDNTGELVIPHQIQPGALVPTIYLGGIIMAKYIAKVNRGTFKNSDGVEKASLSQIGRAVSHSTGNGLDVYLDFAPLVTANGQMEKIILFTDVPRPRQAEDWDGSVANA